MAETIEQVEACRLREEAAQKAYSSAFYAREDADVALTKAAKHSASLVARQYEAENAVQTAFDDAFKLVDAPTKFPGAITKMSQAEDVARVLRRSSLRFAAFDLNDKRRDALLAKLGELERKLDVDQARLAHHLARTYSVLAEAAILNGGIEIKGDPPAVERLREFIHLTEQNIRDARNEIAVLDEKAGKERAEYRVEFGHLAV